MLTCADRLVPLLRGPAVWQVRAMRTPHKGLEKKFFELLDANVEREKAGSPTSLGIWQCHEGIHTRSARQHAAAVHSQGRPFRTLAARFRGHSAWAGGRGDRLCRSEPTLTEPRGRAGLRSSDRSPSSPRARRSWSTTVDGARGRRSNPILPLTSYFLP